MQRKFNPMTLIMVALMFIMVFRSQFSTGYGSLSEWILEKIYILPGVIIGLCFHEYAHAWVANKLGDSTPKLQGRVTINPAAHIDLIGLAALILVGFGWGKPVEINPNNFKKRRRDEFLVSIAGVAMNLLIAVIFTVVLKILYMTIGDSTSDIASIIFQMVFQVVIINLILMIFNLMPIPPLDGFSILTEIFNLRKFSWWEPLYRNGFWIFMLFIVFDFSSRVITPILSWFLGIIYTIL